MLPRFPGGTSPAPQFSLAIAAAWATAAPAAADTWADRLGFPAGSKVVVLHANELGIGYETNAAGTKLLEAGHGPLGQRDGARPWFGDFAEVGQGTSERRRRPRTDAQQRTPHLSLAARGGGRTRAAASPTPTASSGGRPVQTMVNASTDDVERELRAQIRRAKEAGLQPSHLTTHLGTLVTRPDLIEVYLRVARQEWIPAMIVELTPEQVVRFEQNGFPLPDDIIQLLDDYPLPKVDDLRMVADADSYEAKKQAFLKMLSELSPGITQIAFQPAVESDALKRITPDWQQRVWEAQLMADADVRQALESSGILVTDWRR